MPEIKHPKKIIAVSTAGGHWVQLRRLLPAFNEHNIVFITTSPVYRRQAGSCQFYAVNPATRWNKFGLIMQAFKIIKILLYERPNVIVSTGASCGLFSLLFGKMLFNAKTVWVDSMANVEKMSFSGKLARRYADLWLTQWPNLAQPEGPQYKGAVL